MPYLSTEHRDQIRAECRPLKGAERTERVHDWARVLGVHPSTIYRALGGTGRQRRADRGARRCGVSPEAWEKMMALSVAKEMSAPEVVEYAEMNGLIASGQVSPATFNRMLASERVSKSQLQRHIKPFTRFEESFSNERHYIDITGFPDYFVEPDGSIGYESSLSVSKNRAGNGKPRLYLFMLVDGYSRCQHANLYMGKSTLNWVDFCLRAWGPKDDPHTAPFQGRPLYLYSDMESIFRTAMMERFLEAMDVEYHHHVPGVSRAKGKVERVIGVVQNWIRHAFGLMAGKGQKLSLTEANAFVADLTYKTNGRVHSQTRVEPVQRWRSGFADGHSIRVLPDASITDRFFYSSAHRQIGGDLAIQLGGMKWQLPRKEPFINFSGFTVPVFYHTGDTSIQSLYVVLDDVEYEVQREAAVPIKAGEYRAVAKTEQEQLLERLEEVDLSDLTAAGFKERYAQPDFLPAQVEELDEGTLALPRRTINKYRLISELQAEGILSVPPAPQDKAYIDSLYAGDAYVFEDQLDEIIEHLTGQGPQQALAI